MKANAEAERYPGIIKERLGIEVTTQCNIDCSHCFARAGISEPSSLSIELAKEIIGEGYSMGYRHLHITGGEPLLWEGLLEILDYGFELGYKTVFLNTNGTLLTKKVNRQLAKYHGLSVSVSLEGTEALHEHLRGVGFYAQTVRGIERALDAGINLDIFTTACKSLLPELPHFAEDLIQNFPGIDYLTLIQLISPNNGLFALSEELLEPEDFLKLVDKVSLLNLMGLRTHLLNNPLAFVASKLLKIHWVPRSEPLYSEGSLIVKANRDICFSHSSEDSFGKFDSNMIAKVLTSKGYRKGVAPDEKTCPSCQYFELCMENGMIRPSEFYWNIHSGVPYCQKVLNSIEQ